MRKHLLIAGPCCGLAFVPTQAVRAQTTNQTDHQRIEALEARVAALEQRLNMSPITPAPASDHQTSVAPAPKAPARVRPAAMAAAAPAAADWSQLHQGMTPREVTAQIGPPDHKQLRAMSEIWFYPDDRQLEFDRDNRLDTWSKP